LLHHTLVFPWCSASPQATMMEPRTINGNINRLWAKRNTPPSKLFPSHVCFSNKFWLTHLSYQKNAPTSCGNYQCYF
jgi:hypothetical protein